MATMPLPKVPKERDPLQRIHAVIEALFSLASASQHTDPPIKDFVPMSRRRRRRRRDGQCRPTGLRLARQAVNVLIGSVRGTEGRSPLERKTEPASRRGSPYAMARGRYRRQMFGELGVVQGWLDAVNERDATRVEVLSSEQVEIVGPRGQGLMSRSVLGQWLARAGFTSQVVRWFCGADGRVAVEQQAWWHDVATGELQAQLRIGSESVVRDGQVARYVRHDTGSPPRW